MASCKYVGMSDNVMKCYKECPGNFRAEGDIFVCLEECSEGEKLNGRQCINSCKDQGKFD